MGMGWVTIGLVLALASPPEPDERVEDLLVQMTLEEKVGQLMMVGFGGQNMDSRIAHLLHRLHIGSIALYNRNIRNTSQLTHFIREIRKEMANEIQPFLAIDQEGGNVVRVQSDVMVLPGAMTLGATRDPVLSFLSGQANAIDLKLLGIDMNLAPVLDINRGASNPVINVRSFGDRPELVAELGSTFIQGQQQGGLASIAKHFPGHGTTTSDSHFSLPRIDLGAEQLHQIELMPFRRAIEEGLDGIMTAHVQVPAIDPGGTPASLSYQVITGLLREKLHFDGLVITDDLEMHAIVDRFGIGRAAVQSIQAGADIVMVIWTPSKKEEVFNALLSAGRDGTLSAERINTSVRRILHLKAVRGTLDACRQTQTEQTASFPNPLHERLMNVVASRGLTLVRNEKSLIPLCPRNRILVASPYEPFSSEMKRQLPEAKILPLTLVPSQAQRENQLNTLVELSKQYQAVVIAVANAYQAWLVQELSHRTTTPLVVLSFGSPYLLMHFPQVAGYLCSYSFLLSTQLAAARALVGKQSITGRLPVTISERYPSGFGLTIGPGACSATAMTGQATPLAK
jgi:beta-N-acetylhexosaminidase